MQNNILAILKSKDISINKMSEDIKLDYATVHRIVNRKNLSNTSIGRLKLIADYLKVNIEDLYCDDYIDFTSFYDKDILDLGLSTEEMASCFCFLFGVFSTGVESGYVSNFLFKMFKTSIDNIDVN